MKLITFAHAGGFGSYYRPLKVLACDSVQVINYEYSGHAARLHDPLFTDASEALDFIYDELFRNGINDDIVLFGHSLGAATAMELAARLTLNGYGDQLAGLIVSGMLPPAYYKPCGVDLTKPAAVIKYLEDLGGTQKSVAHNKAFMDMYLKIVTADLGLFDTYTFTVLEKPMRCFLKVLYAVDDKYLQPISGMTEWAAFSENYLNTVKFTGGHFYISEHWDSVIAETADLLKHAEKCRERMHG